MVRQREIHTQLFLLLAVTTVVFQSSCSASNSGPEAPAQDSKIIDREHIEWCYKRRKDYRLSDNTFLGSDGKRHTCISQR